MSNTTHPTTVSTPSSTPETPQIKPQCNTFGFWTPRTEGAPYPPYSLREAEELLFQTKDIPPALAAFDEDLLNEAYRARENADAASTLAGMLFRALEAEGSKSLSLARALCLVLHEADYAAEMIEEYLCKAILKAFGQEVR